MIADGIGERGEIFIEPAAPVECVQALEQNGVDAGQVADIILGVFDLPGRERPLQPVGAALGLVQLDIEDLPDQVGVADLIPQAQHRGGDLGVEQRLRQLIEKLLEDLQILAGGVKYLGDGPVLEEPLDGAQIIDGQRIDAGGDILVADLDQRQPGVVGALAHELGVDGKKFALAQLLAEPLEILGPIDELGLHGKNGHPVNGSAILYRLTPVGHRQCDIWDPR